MIRPAMSEDIPRLTALLEQVLQVHHRGRPDLFKGEGTKYGEKELEELLKDKKKPIFVYETGGQVQGYAFCVLERASGAQLEDEKRLYIDDLCVDEACRGQGIGKALYGYVKRFAREQGCRRVTLNVWCLNEGAMRFYESLGMKPYRIGMEEIL